MEEEGSDDDLVKDAGDDGPDRPTKAAGTPSGSKQPAPSSLDDMEAADWLLQGAQMRIECAKVCAPTQLPDIIEGSQAVFARVRRLKDGSALRRLLQSAKAEHEALHMQWQQRSGTIRVVVRIRPLPSSSDEAEAAVKLVSGAARCRGITVAVPRDSFRGTSAELHKFMRFDYILGPDMSQEAVFNELAAMLPHAGPGGLSGTPQSACILAYGQTGSGKTHTMHGGSGHSQGLVPRVLVEVFRLADGGGAAISLSAVEVYNDTAYDLLDGARPDDFASGGGRGFQLGRLPPPPGLNFRHGCASALGQATSLVVAGMEEAQAVLEQAAQRRSTRSTVFNATSSRSHSLVFVHALSPGASEPLIRLAFVDLAGSERLPASEVGGLVAEESRHINMSLSSLGSVIHALRHRSNHLPYRSCLLTRLLEPYFGASGRVLLCVCASPAMRHAQETLCSLTFADRASRAVLGADSAVEVQRGQALALVRELYAALRAKIRELCPAAAVGVRTRQRLPNAAAALMLQYMAEHGPAAFVCRAWAGMCQSHTIWGRSVSQQRRLAESILQFLSPAMEAAGVCRCWWHVAGAYRVVMEPNTAKVMEASAGSHDKLWSTASARTRSVLWKSLLAAGGGSGARGEMPLAKVRECVIHGAPKPEALKQVLLRCSEIRVVEIPNPDLVSAACAGLVDCKNLRALSCTLKPLPVLLNLRQLLLNCRQLKVLVVTGSSELGVSLQFLAAEFPQSCALQELTVARCTAEYRDIELLTKSCKRLRVLRFPLSFVEVGDSPLDPPPFMTLPRLKHLRAVDFRACSGRAYKQRPWLTDDMLGVLEHFRNMREVRLSDQKLVGERCFWLLRRHSPRLRVLHLDGCQAMSGDSAFSFLQRCEGMELLRLPQLVTGHSERKLGLSTNRWCQSLNCPHLRELSVDAWASLEDSGVQMIVTQCRQLRTVALRHAPRLSDDAIIYLTSLSGLTDLSLSYNVGLTSLALEELQTALRLVRLDLSGCRQLTEAAVVAFATELTKPNGPPLRSIQLDHCPNLGRDAAVALASAPKLRSCSLSSCRPIPLAATAWEDERSRGEACRVLGCTAPTTEACGDDDVAVPLLVCARPPEAEDAKLCAVCLDEIGADEAAWECPVCCNRLHDTEDCARGWLRLRQSCPTCRAAAWAPPEETVVPSLGSRPPPPRRRPGRAASVDALAHSSSRTPRAERMRTPPTLSPTALPLLSVAGAHMQFSHGADTPLAPLAGALSAASHARFEPRNRRPPRPSANGATSATAQGAGGAWRPLAAQAQRVELAERRAARSRSLSSARPEFGGLALVGAAIVGIGLT